MKLKKSWFLVSLQVTTKRTDICKAVVNTLSEANVDFSKIVSVTTDGAPNMTGRFRVYQFIY